VKVVFPGQIKRSLKDPEVPTQAEAATDSTDQADLASTSSAAFSKNPRDASGPQPAEEASTSRPVLPPYEESRIRKFNKLLEPQMVDLAALQEVRAPA
jgi:hypothetical protein